MKYIEVDEELYRHIASKTERIGESASDILRRLLGLSVQEPESTVPSAISEPSLEKGSATIAASAPESDANAGSVPQATDMAASDAESSAQMSKADRVKPEFSTLVNEHLLSQQKGAVGRFLFLLESLYNAAPNQFEQVLQIQGRDRLYFATSKAALLKASKSANPKEIGSSGFWVTSNNNTAKKQTILAEVLVQFGCDAALATTLAAKV